MRVKLLTFGVLRDLLPRTAGHLDLPPGATVAELLDQCRRASAGPDALWSSIAVAVNQEYVPATHPLAENDEIALLPPVSGGAGHPSPAVELTDAVIDPSAVLASLKRGEDGAVVVFDGIVRNNTRGRRTLYLFYDAYP